MDRTDRGFTMVEILIAIVLVGILSTVVVVGVSRLVSMGSGAGCAASKDAARAAAAAAWASTGNHPTTFTEMTAVGALDLPSDVGVGASGRLVTGDGWTLAMVTASGTRAPVFACSTELPPGAVVGPSGHVYLLVTTPSTWAQANANAASTSVGGSPGYLVTVTSSAENLFVTGLTTTNLWLGGTDTNEGDWRWAGGPEAGTAFWAGGPRASGGVAVGGSFTNWYGTEPNNNQNQDCLRRRGGTPTWDDLQCWQMLAYVVEIGG